MCGICGIYGSDDPNVIENMVQSIAHRGPDDRAVSYQPPFALGAARLSLVSRDDGQQPFLDRNRGLAVLLNGEIYNYLELHRSLIGNGEVFTTGSEAEVIAALYRLYGDGFASHIDGMFAIVIVDGTNLTLVRDPFGIKPLFFFSSSNRFAFASEMKALLPLLISEPTINTNVLEETFVFGYPVSLTETIFSEISQVGPGEIVKWIDGKITRSSYGPALWEFVQENSFEGTIPYDEAVRQLGSCIISVVGRMWEHGSDEKGIYLSGGLDSSLLTIIASNVLKKRVHTFTLTDGADHPDCKYARWVADVAGSSHHQFKVSVKDYLDILPHFVVHYEGLMAGGVFDIHGGMAFHLLSREIGKRMRIAFSGEGADELFGGYRWIHTHPLGFSDRIRQRVEKVQPGKRVTKMVDDLFPVPEDEETYRKSLFRFLLAGGLANYHLTSVDRSCGAFGFEVRPAYLNPEIARFACSLPMSYKVSGKEMTKRILRDVALPYFRQLGIEEVVTRTKQGMPAAVGGLAPQLSDVLGYYGRSHQRPHPFERYITSDSGFLLFDLFYYLMVRCRGMLPKGFSLEEFVAGGTIKRLYN